MKEKLSQEYINRIKTIHRQLGIPEDYERQYQLWMQSEATESELVSVGLDVFNREQFLLSEVQKRWRVMRKTAQRDFIEINIVSCFRSVDYQTGLIQKKIDDGQSMENILRVSAAPGHSEHHTGRAIDVGTSGCEHLTEEFEESVAFQWLMQHGEKYGFKLSYPKENDSNISPGIAYEPWHWAYEIY